MLVYVYSFFFGIYLHQQKRCFRKIHAYSESQEKKLFSAPRIFGVRFKYFRNSIINLLFLNNKFWETMYFISRFQTFTIFYKKKSENMVKPFENLYQHLH